MEHAGPGVAPPLSQEDRDQYLAFGFLPQAPDTDGLMLLADWSRGPRRDERSVSAASLVREGVRALRAGVDECASRASGAGDQVVFLSGGLDSRTILGAVLERYAPGEVVTATFGLPGEQDFDFAAVVAQAAGVRHEVLQSFSVPWTTQDLVDSVLARETPLPFPFGQRYLSYRLHTRIGTGHTFWDGLCGDAVSGAHLRPEHEGLSWEAAVAGFSRAHLLQDAEHFTSPGFRAESCLPTAPWCSPTVLSYPDQLDFAVRQTRYIATRCLRGYPIMTPFLSRDWLDFMLSVPVRYRLDQRLYIAVQRSAYPRLFALPTTTYDGRGLPRSHGQRRVWALQRRALRKLERLGLGPKPTRRQDKSANGSIRRSHRERADVRRLLLDNLGDLARRGLVPGVEAVSRAVAEGRAHHTRTNVLLGLELNLKAVDHLRRGETGVGE